MATFQAGPGSQLKSANRYCPRPPCRPQSLSVGLVDGRLCMAVASGSEVVIVDLEDGALVSRIFFHEAWSTNADDVDFVAFDPHNGLFLSAGSRAALFTSSRTVGSQTVWTVHSTMRSGSQSLSAAVFNESHILLVGDAGLELWGLPGVEIGLNNWTILWHTSGSQRSAGMYVDDDKVAVASSAPGSNVIQLMQLGRRGNSILYSRTIHCAGPPTSVQIISHSAHTWSIVALTKQRKSLMIERHPISPSRSRSSEMASCRLPDVLAFGTDQYGGKAVAVLANGACCQLDIMSGHVRIGPMLPAAFHKLFLKWRRPFFTVIRGGMDPDQLVFSSHFEGCSQIAVCEVDFTIGAVKQFRTTECLDSNARFAISSRPMTAVLTRSSLRVASFLSKSSVAASVASSRRASISSQPLCSPAMWHDGAASFCAVVMLQEDFSAITQIVRRRGRHLHGYSITLADFPKGATCFLLSPALSQDELVVGARHDGRVSLWLLEISSSVANRTAAILESKIDLTGIDVQSVEPRVDESTARCLFTTLSRRHEACEWTMPKKSRASNGQQAILWRSLRYTLKPGAVAVAHKGDGRGLIAVIATSSRCLDVYVLDLKRQVSETIQIPGDVPAKESDIDVTWVAFPHPAFSVTMTGRLVIIGRVLMEWTILLEKNLIAADAPTWVGSHLVTRSLHGLLCLDTSPPLLRFLEHGNRPLVPFDARCLKQAVVMGHFSFASQTLESYDRYAGLAQLAAATENTQKLNQPRALPSHFSNGILLAWQHRHALDINGQRYLALQRNVDAAPVAHEFSRLCAFAYHSKTQPVIVSICEDELQGSKLTWVVARKFGLFRWVASQDIMGRLCETVARNEYAASRDERDPIACSLFYLALKKKTLLLGLWKIAYGHPDRTNVLKFLANDFEDPRWMKAARKNAFALMSKQRFLFAASFFLLGDSLQDAVNICVRQLGDVDLAIAIARVHGGDHCGPLRGLLHDHILPLALSQGDRWLASWALSLLGEKQLACLALVAPLDKVVSHLDRHLDAPVVLHSMVDPGLAVMYQHQRRSLDLSLFNWAPRDIDVAVRAASDLWDLGCAALIPAFLRQWSWPARAPAPQSSHRTLPDKSNVQRVEQQKMFKPAAAPEFDLAAFF